MYIGDWATASVLAMDRDSAIAKFSAARTRAYTHVGDVPDWLAARTPASGRASGPTIAVGQPSPVIEWIVDTGAALHVISKDAASRTRFKRVLMRQYGWVTGVGGSGQFELDAVVNFDE